MHPVRGAPLGECVLPIESGKGGSAGGVGIPCFEYFTKLNHDKGFKEKPLTLFGRLYFLSFGKEEKDSTLLRILYK